MKRQATATNSDVEPLPPGGCQRTSENAVAEPALGSESHRETKKPKTTHPAVLLETPHQTAPPLEESQETHGEGVESVAPAGTPSVGFDSNQRRGKDSCKDVGGSFGSNEGKADLLTTTIVEEEAGPISYAEAVLAGLPPDDEAVQMANLAKQSGKTLDDLVEFCYVSSSSGVGGGASTAASVIATDPYSGRLTDASGWHGVQDEFDGNLYKDMHGWCDSRHIEEQLMRVKEARMKGLPKQGWKKKSKQKKE